MEKSIKNSTYLPGLNGLRAIAAFGVLYSHINLGLENFGLPKGKTTDFAGFGVTIFFALSGFLITYLLIKEKKTYSTINIPKFYFRRILRIWPLYFLIFSIGFLIKSMQWDNYFWFILLMLPNFSFSFELPMHLVGHFWSLGVEEQFYSFWPLIIKKSNRLEILFIVFIIIFLVLKVFMNIYFGSYSKIYTLIYSTRFDCMAIGGLGAWLLIYKENFVGKLNNRKIELLIWIIIFLTIINKFHVLSIIDHEIIALVTVIIIFHQITFEKKLINLEKKWLNYLGSISFGIYMFHPLMITINSIWIKDLEIKNDYKMILLYFVIIVSTLIISHFSYFYFESRILKFKYKFSKL